MCVIAVSLKGHKFSEKDLRKMWDSNPHGAGVAWIEKRGQVKVMKGLMTFDQLIEVYETVPEAMHVLHFRLRSAGEILPQLTHPFRVDAVDTQKLRYTAKAVLFHNGTVSDWRTLYIAVLSSFTKKERDKILGRCRTGGLCILQFCLLLRKKREIRFCPWSVYLIHMSFLF